MSPTGHCLRSLSFLFLAFATTLVVGLPRSGGQQIGSYQPAPGSLELPPAELELRIRYQRVTTALRQLKTLQTASSQVSSALVAKLSLTTEQIESMAPLTKQVDPLFDQLREQSPPGLALDKTRIERIEALALPLLKQAEELLTATQWRDFGTTVEQELMHSLISQGLGRGIVVCQLLDLPKDFAQSYDASYREVWNRILTQRQSFADQAEAKIFAAVPSDDLRKLKGILAPNTFAFLHTRAVVSQQSESQRLERALASKEVSNYSAEDRQLIREVAYINAVALQVEVLQGTGSARLYNLTETQRQQIAKLPEFDFSDWPAQNYGIKIQRKFLPLILGQSSSPKPVVDFKRLRADPDHQPMLQQAQQAEQTLWKLAEAKDEQRFSRILYGMQFHRLCSDCPTLEPDTIIGWVCEWDEEQTEAFTAVCNEVTRELRQQTSRVVIDEMKTLADGLPLDKRADFLRLIDQDTWRMVQRN